MKNHDGHLGRIVRAIPRDASESSSSLHPFIYDIELILGGKVNGLERVDLKYTTASAEGMIGDSKRKRKPTAIPHDSPEKKAEKAAKAPKGKTGPKKQKKKAATSKNTTTKAGKKRPAKGNSNTKAKKSKVSKATTNAVEDAPSAPISGKDLYERHRKEFERSINRLEKADPYHWFLGDVPKEYDECYLKQPLNPSLNQGGESSTADGGANDKAPISESVDSNEIPSSTANSDLQKEAELQFPDHPPYNFSILRKRMEHGRYVLDREAVEVEERTQLMTPYLKSIGARVPKRGSKKTKNSSLPVLCQKAVDWEAFRKDVIGMCDSAEERNLECDDGSAGTISHTCKKIKDTLEQIYEKFGLRHNIEICSTNDRHRFFSAIESVDNKEAAMQGRWRKEGMFIRHLIYNSL